MLANGPWQYYYAPCFQFFSSRRKDLHASLKMHIVALEGPAHAGKSTLARNLKNSLPLKSILVLPDYVEFAGGPQALPGSPLDSIQEELAAFRTLLDLDRRRISTGLSSIPEPDLIIMDRSVHTFLAHRFSLSRLSGIPIFEQCWEIAVSEVTSWPSVILYIDVPQTVLNSRYPRRSGELPILRNELFNEGFHSYFVSGQINAATPVFILDGNQSEDELRQAGLEAISLTLPDSLKGGIRS
jgi:thymidylate kinase